MIERRLTVVFRVDASIKIGTGHVMRCLTLADELVRQNHKCHFICRKHLGHLGDLIVSKGHSLTLLAATEYYQSESEQMNRSEYAFWLGASWYDDAIQTLNALASLKPDWLVVDHYGLDAQWENAISTAVGQLIVIDDLADRPHKCKLLLDQNFGRAAEDYDELLPAECQRLIGPCYALLRPEFALFRQKSLKRRVKPELKRILISLGGVDRSNITGQILKELASSSLPSCTELDIIVGGTSPHLNEVRELATYLPFNASVSVDVSDMAERMCLADLAIGAGGSTSWERCCLGLPAIIFVLAENQKHSAKLLSEYKAIVIANTIVQTRVLIEGFIDKKSLQRGFSAMTRAAQDIVDGDGCKRVVQIITSKTSERR